MKQPRRPSTPTDLQPLGPTPLASSSLKKRSLMLAGHATSLALEDAFWRALERWAADENRSVSDLVAEIDAARTLGTLASAVRVALLRRAEAKPHTGRDTRSAQPAPDPLATPEPSDDHA